MKSWWVDPIRAFARASGWPMKEDDLKRIVILCEALEELGLSELVVQSLHGGVQRSSPSSNNRSSPSSNNTTSNHKGPTTT